MISPREPLPWAEIMAFGFGKLRLSPTVFWSMSLRELNAAIRWHLPNQGNAIAMNRGSLDALMNQFPDKDHGEPNGT